MEFKLTVLKNKNNLQGIVEFFIAHKTNNYISHGEILDGRAIDFDTWSENLESILLNELKNQNITVIIAEDIDQNIKGIMIIKQVMSSRQKILFFDDIIVDKNTRGHSLGSKLMDFAIQYAKTSGIKLIFAESGINNEKAHHFIEKNGFQKVSVSYMMDLN